MKAIIMAGGEGTRLRPLTCDCPKPMIRLMNRPVMAYALDLLKRHGITQITATLGCLSDVITDCFGEGDAFGVDLRYSIEKTPLGTAGGVKQASVFLDETFIVLSGDGVTDLDITAAAAFHRERGALATLVLKHADNPLDYGVVCLDEEGRVASFHEKPGWSDVLSDTVNTGIYILEPEVLDRVPSGRACDFGHELFPALVREGLPVFGYVTQDYWCDIGDVRAYLNAHVDAMEGRIHLDGLFPAPGRAVQLPGAMVDRAAVLEGPCLIGANARVLAGACVGPYSVVGEGCVIGEGASVKRSVLWSGARLEPRSQARGCVLGARAILGPDAQAYEDSVLGTGAQLGARATLQPGVKLWPGKQSPEGTRVEANLVWGSRLKPGFENGALALTSPAEAVRAAQATVAALDARTWLLGRSSNASAAALWHALAAGAMAQGVRVLDAGICPLPLLRFTQRLLGCDGAALITEGGMIPLNECGARLLNRQQRGLLAQYARQDLRPPFSAGIFPVEPAGPVGGAYAADLAARFTADPSLCPAMVICAEDAALRSLAEQVCLRVGLRFRIESEAARGVPGPGELALWLEDGGESFSLADETGMLCEAEHQLLCAWTLLEGGCTSLLLPMSATRVIRQLCDQRGARAEYIAGEPALWGSELSRRAPEQFRMRFDGPFAALSALSCLTESGLTLTDWRAAMPAITRRRRSVNVPAGQTGRVLQAFARHEAGVELGGGLRFHRDGGWVWICPDETRPELRIITESTDAETARELCDFCESTLRRIAGTEHGV